MALTLKKPGLVFRKFKRDLWGDFILRSKVNKLKNFLFLFFFKSYSYRRILGILNKYKYFNAILKYKKISQRYKSFLIISRHILVTSIFDQLKLSKSNYFNRIQKSKVKRFTPFKRFLYDRQRFQLFYGGFSYTKLRRFFINAKCINKVRVAYFIMQFEFRLDVLLYRANFVSTIKEANFLIKKGYVLVNNRVVLYPDYRLKFKDIISIDRSIRKGMFLKVLLRLKALRLRLFMHNHLCVDYKNLLIIPLYMRYYKDMQLFRTVNPQRVFKNFK